MIVEIHLKPGEELNNVQFKWLKETLRETGAELDFIDVWSESDDSYYRLLRSKQG